MDKRTIITALCAVATLSLAGCFGGKASMASGGEVTGTGGKAFSEPTPYGMVMIPRGHLKMGLEKEDSLWGKQTPVRDISVEGFWMDEKEITNSQYRQFVYYVRDSIIRERLADPAYGGDETYKIEEDENGDPVKPYLNWKKAIPRKPNEDELRAIESVYTTNPVTGEKMLDASQMNYRYEIYDYAEAAKRKYRTDPAQRNLNTDVRVNPDEQVWISKDTAYIDDEGRVVRQTINRPRSGPWDFLNTYIVNIYPDTTCWVNDFPNADNESYMRLYFSNPAYNDYPVVGVTWEQANAFCVWRTEFLLRGLGRAAQFVQRYRLPTEAEWEYAARGGKYAKGCRYSGSNNLGEVGKYYGNSHDTLPVEGSRKPNELRLYDMTGSVHELCSDYMGDYSAEEQVCPVGPASGSERVMRGGSFGDDPINCRISARFGIAPDKRASNVGLRLALSL